MTEHYEERRLNLEQNGERKTSIVDNNMYVANSIIDRSGALIWIMVYTEVQYPYPTPQAIFPEQLMINFFFLFIIFAVLYNFIFIFMMWLDYT